MSTDCEAVREQLSLYLYGELSFDEEERVDAHLDTCDPCTKALASTREMHASFDGIAVEPSAALLRASREGLWQALKNESAPHKSIRSWWHRFTESISFHHDPSQHLGWMRPVGAIA